jgi:DNA-binding response OmpR family regulator
MAVSILVVDDEESILESVTFALERDGYLTHSASSGIEALKMYHQAQPDLIVLDWMLPDLSGIDVCEELRRSSRVPILMLTARDQLQDKVLGLETGADDYLIKPFRFPELLARVKALLRRASPASSGLSYGEIQVDQAAHIAYFQERPLPLTLKEYQLLEWLVRRPQTAWTKEQLLSQLWGWDPGTDSNVLEVHISALRHKLGEQGKKLIRTIRGVGYSLG